MVMVMVMEMAGMVYVTNSVYFVVMLLGILL